MDMDPPPPPPPPPAHALARMKGVCRMCGERYVGIESIDIFEPRGTQPSYADLLRQLMGLNPMKGDFKPDRIGLTCAKLLEDWVSFQNQCVTTQMKLRERATAEKNNRRQQQQQQQQPVQHRQDNQQAQEEKTLQDKQNQLEQPGPSGLSTTPSTSKLAPSTPTSSSATHALATKRLRENSDKGDSDSDDDAFLQPKNKKFVDA